jgi:hypothetical protein
LFFVVDFHIIGCDSLKEVNIFVGVKLGHFVAVRGFGPVNLHLLVHPIVHDQAMREPDSMRLHRMTSHIGIVADVRVVEVCDSLVVRRAPGRINWRKLVRHGEEVAKVAFAEGLDARRVQL